MKSTLLAMGMIVLGMSGVAAQETAIERGEAQFRKCQPCHKIGEGAANTIGPVLNDVMGRQAGTYPDYAYSAVLREAGANGLVWTVDTLSQFLASPRKVAPGTKMTFAGMRSHADRWNLIAYLRTLSPGYESPAK